MAIVLQESLRGLFYAPYYAALALRQSADYVVALAPESGQSGAHHVKNADPLELLHVEGRYAVYRVKSAQLVQRQR